MRGIVTVSEDGGRKISDIEIKLPDNLSDAEKQLLMETLRGEIINTVDNYAEYVKMQRSVK